MPDPQIRKEFKFQVELTFHVEAADSLKALEKIVAYSPVAPVSHNVDMLTDEDDIDD